MEIVYESHTYPENIFRMKPKPNCNNPSIELPELYLTRDAVERLHLDYRTHFVVVVSIRPSKPGDCLTLRTMVSGSGFQPHSTREKENTNEGQES